MADSREPTCLGCAQRDRDLARREAQNRRLLEDLEWQESQVRVFRRVIARLVMSQDKP